MYSLRHTIVYHALVVEFVIELPGTCYSAICWAQQGGGERKVKQSEMEEKIRIVTSCDSHLARVREYQIYSPADSDKWTIRQCDAATTEAIIVSQHIVYIRNYYQQVMGATIFIWFFFLRDLNDFGTKFQFAFQLVSSSIQTIFFEKQKRANEWMNERERACPRLPFNTHDSITSRVTNFVTLLHLIPPFTVHIPVS